MRYHQNYRVAVWKTQTQSKTEHHNINKFYCCDQWQAFWTWYWTGLFRNLYITCTIKTPQVALYCIECRNTQHRCNVRAVYTVDILRRISGQCGHHTAGLSTGCSSHVHIETAQCSEDRWQWAAALFKFRWNFLYSNCSITNWQHRSTGTVLPCILSQTNPVDLPLPKPWR